MVPKEIPPSLTIRESTLFILEQKYVFFAKLHSLEWCVLPEVVAKASVILVESNCASIAATYKLSIA